MTFKRAHSHAEAIVTGNGTGKSVPITMVTTVYIVSQVAGSNVTCPIVIYMRSL